MRAETLRIVAERESGNPVAEAAVRVVTRAQPLVADRDDDEPRLLTQQGPSGRTATEIRDEMERLRRKAREASERRQAAEQAKRAAQEKEKARERLGFPGSQTSRDSRARTV